VIGGKVNTSVGPFCELALYMLKPETLNCIFTVIDIICKKIHRGSCKLLERLGRRRMSASLARSLRRS
jgi:hypothetical protein